MFTQNVAVHYVDGSRKDLVLDQWSVGQWGQYATRQGWNIDIAQQGFLAVTMLRYQAWAQLHRDVVGSRPGFDVWDRTVIEVEGLEDPEEVNPTQTGT